MEAVYLPVGHSYLGCPEQLNARDTFAVLKTLLEDVAVPKLSSNAKRDTIACLAHGVKLAGVVFDTMLASYLLDPDLRGHDIAEVALRRENRELSRYAELVGKGKAERTLGESSESTASDHFQDSARRGA